MATAPLFEVKNFRFSYGRHLVLKDVSLQVTAGSIHGILGGNGAGKTTFFNALFEQHRFPDMMHFPESLPGNIAYLPTENFFYPYMTGAEYLKIIASGISPETIAGWNALFDLPLKDYAQHYSTGMKKKLAIVGVLLLDKELLILDEPFNGLDLPACEMLRTIFERLRAKGKTILLSSHIYETLLSNCDRISVLEEGVISGTYERYAYPLLTEKIQAQFRDAVSKKIEELLP